MDDKVYKNSKDLLRDRDLFTDFEWNNRMIHVYNVLLKNEKYGSTNKRRKRKC